MFQRGRYTTKQMGLYGIKLHPTRPMVTASSIERLGWLGWLESEVSLDLQIISDDTLW